jgi:hypothetical protein
VVVSGGTVRALALFVAGVLVFADSPWLAGAGELAVVALLAVIGWMERRLRAVWWATLLLASAVVADILWFSVAWAPFDRDADYEAIPQTPFVAIALPIPMAIVALGVGAGWLWRRARRRSSAA